MTTDLKSAIKCSKVPLENIVSYLLWRWNTNLVNVFFFFFLSWCFDIRLWILVNKFNVTVTSFHKMLLCFIYLGRTVITDELNVLICHPEDRKKLYDEILSKRHMFSCRFMVLPMGDMWPLYIWERAHTARVCLWAEIFVLARNKNALSRHLLKQRHKMSYKKRRKSCLKPAIIS